MITGFMTFVSCRSQPESELRDARDALCRCDVAEVDAGRVERGVAELILNLVDGDAAAGQFRSVGVPEAMWVDALVDPSPIGVAVEHRPHVALLERPAA